jgi:hypothetical protein
MFFTLEGSIVSFILLLSFALTQEADLPKSHARRFPFEFSHVAAVGNNLQDARVLPKLHRRVYLDRVERDELTVYISFYIEVCPCMLESISLSSALLPNLLNNVSVTNTFGSHLDRVRMTASAMALVAYAMKRIAPVQ